MTVAFLAAISYKTSVWKPLRSRLLVFFMFLGNFQMSHRGGEHAGALRFRKVISDVIWSKVELPSQR